MQNDAKSLVEAYLEAFSKPGPRTTLEPLLAAGLKVTSPLGEFNSREEFLSDVASDRLRVSGLAIERVIAEGNRVGVLYRVSSGDPYIRELLVSEWFDIEGGKITAITSSFDASAVRSSMRMI